MLHTDAENVFADDDSEALLGSEGGAERGVAEQLKAAELSTSIRSAKETFRKILHAQAESALALRTAPDAECPQDAAVRRSMVFVLPDEAVRLLFLSFVSSAKRLPRAVHLFGAPPYGFLKREDCSLLNAVAFSKGRVRMAYVDAIVCNYSQFGRPHFYDAAGRQYRVLYSKDAVYDAARPLPQHTHAWQVGGHLDAAIRIPKRGRNGAKSLCFPGAADELDLFVDKPVASHVQRAFVAKVSTLALRVRDSSGKTALIRFLLLSKGEPGA